MQIICAWFQSYVNAIDIVQWFKCVYSVIRLKEAGYVVYSVFVDELEET